MIQPIVQKQNKVAEPKVYALMLEYPDSNYLSVQCAYSLEEAFVLSKIEFEEIQRNVLAGTNKVLTLVSPKLGLFSSKTLNEINNAPELIDILKQSGELREIKPITPLIEKVVEPVKDKIEIKKDPIKIKNTLMKKIIKSKDLNLLKENKDNLTKSEVLFIKDEIKKNVNI